MESFSLLPKQRYLGLNISDYFAHLMRFLSRLWQNRDFLPRRHSLP